MNALLILLFDDRIAPNYKIECVEWNHDKDHIHILFKAHPKSEISKFINAYKAVHRKSGARPVK